MRPDCETIVATSSVDRIARWLDLMRTSDKLLLAGLRRKIGPDGNLNAAYQAWYDEHMRQHDVIVERIARFGRGSQETGDARCGMQWVVV
jgi:hypothetical protein